MRKKSKFSSNVAYVTRRRSVQFSFLLSRPSSPLSVTASSEPPLGRGYLLIMNMSPGVIGRRLCPGSRLSATLHLVRPPILSQVSIAASCCNSSVENGGRLLKQFAHGTLCLSVTHTDTHTHARTHARTRTESIG